MIKKYFRRNNLNRSQKANFNIILSIFFKGGSIALQLVLVSLTVNYIKPDVYGVWLTVSSLVGWIAIFDIGIGNGLRNKLSESLAKNDFKKARIYVSTTYAIIGIIAIIFIVLYFLVSPFVSWQNVFNSSFIPEKELYRVVTVVSLCFLLKFVTDIINIVAASFQMVSISSILLFISNVALTGAVWILTKTTHANLVLLALCLSFFPVVISLVATFYLFKKNFKLVSPSLKAVDFKESKSIMSLGSQFFILQIITLIVFQTDNILIAQLFHPSDVTDFNISYKYFNIVSMFFTILIAPYWTAFTEAFFKNEYVWIEKTINTLIKYWFYSIIVLIIMIFYAKYIIKLWVGNAVIVSLPLSLSICLYIVVFNWNSIFASFLNGVGKIRIQIICAIVMGIVNIPLSIFFVRVLKFGIFAMPASNFICLSIGAIICFIQYKKIIKNVAKGIWNK
ncbi:polysaccharide biosynthesis protein [Flavobacterium plurextorum]|uniref:oligosaccharide flippase family protein n=1 Tax=Flavobacterium TaxID=237 RepID=UPI00214DC15F|nr:MULTISPECIES: oligosaccharide flippase family protein [Flavobacterium]UUW09503.1 polysaccharide biosynthesis protein [Flavobacterium plurextorum]